MTSEGPIVCLVDDDRSVRDGLAKTIALANERSEVDIARRRLDARVLLIKALGGGWDVASLPRM